MRSLSRCSLAVGLLAIHGESSADKSVGSNTAVGDAFEFVRSHIGTNNRCRLSHSRRDERRSTLHFAKSHDCGTGYACPAKKVGEVDLCIRGNDDRRVSGSWGSTLGASLRKRRLVSLARVSGRNIKWRLHGEMPMKRNENVGRSPASGGRRSISRREFVEATAIGGAGLAMLVRQCRLGLRRPSVAVLRGYRTTSRREVTR
jgi:hypothetical protein